MELARRGVLVTRLSAAEDAANMDVLCADKTGTLTMNRLSYVGARPQSAFHEDDVLRFGAVASHEADQDPIDLAFLKAARERHLLTGAEKTQSFVPFSPKTRRTEATVAVDGQAFRVMKGAVRRIAEVLGLDDAAIASLEAQAAEEAHKGVRVLAVARGESGNPLQLVGLALLRDAPRPDSKQLIDELRSLGVTVKMLTGDALPVAQAVGRELGFGEIVRAPDLRSAQKNAIEDANKADGFAEMYPEDKFLVVQDLQAAGHVVGMTGDGVNDAPPLRQAEVGIAVSGSTDIAKSAASVVLTNEGLANIVDLVKNGRAIYQRVLTWIVNKVSRTILKSGFVVIAFLILGKFVISPLAMVLLVFMTDFVKISLSTDRVQPSRKPETWNIGPLVVVAVVLGILMVLEALVALAIGWHLFGLDEHDGKLHMFSFLVLLFLAIFSIVSIRERRFFWASWPSGVLAAALFADGCVGVAIGLIGFGQLHPLPIETIAFLLVYSLVVSLGVNDVVKWFLIRHPLRLRSYSAGAK
jgi:magnesium-transporting ATPase (P-type)